MMNKSHQILSKNTPKKLNHTILEIGGGAKPHCSVVPLKGIYEYWVSDSREIFKKNANLADYNIKNHIYEDDRLLAFQRFKHFIHTYNCFSYLGAYEGSRGQSFEMGKLT